MTRLRHVGIPADFRSNRHGDFHMAAEEYLTAIIDGVGARPLIIPALGPGMVAWLDGVDGLLVPGNASNVHPDLYGGPAPRDEKALDAARDATALPLIGAAIARGIPLLCICRGFQELNVALGGTLHQQVHEQPGMLDHRADYAASDEVQYGPAHVVRLSGRLRDIAGSDEIQVNSLHGQGIDRLAPGLVAEAVAPDGLVEGVRVAAATAFAQGVQWHPEWHFRERPADLALIQAFGRAVAGQG